ncbi:hypothetical protein RchiOBHm_Chr2g0168231 [Rosa chinensis]|uniref:Uncharacterized protein n=1 Tax=Rosa chinensis TaxID=74649 RepID=A0A2P6S4I0_ROSCH|nr:hypothetical protein RchiOBHm_Chr2g0168231 [Rosa chinensis]
MKFLRGKIGWTVSANFAGFWKFSGHHDCFRMIWRMIRKIVVVLLRRRSWIGAGNLTSQENREGDQAA